MVAGRLSLIAGLFVAIFVSATPALLHAKKKARRQAAVFQGPKRLVLGVDSVAVLRLKNPRPGVRFYTNVGRIASTKDTKGGLEVVYEPPKSAFPQVAIIVAATPDHALFTWTALPLYGSPKIRIQSIRRADVVAKVGDETFGPVRTDKNGDAELKVVVPPGLQAVALTTTDRLGTVSRSSTALNAPQFGRILAICPTGDADAVRVVAIHSSGAPLRKAKLKLESSVSLGAARLIRPGVYAARVPAGSERDKQSFDLRAHLEGSKEFSSDCQGKRPGALPSALQVRLAEQSFRAGSSASVRVKVALEYDSKQRRRTPVLLVEASLGTVSPLELERDGQLWASWDLPDGFQGQRQASITVRSEQKKTLADRAEILLQAGPLATIEVRASSRSLVANGSTETKVIATLLDAYGNGVNGAPPIADDVEGLSPFSPMRESGRYLALYQPSRSFAAQQVELRVRAPKAALESKVLIDLIAARRRFVADLSVGYTTNTGIVRALSGALALATRLPVGANYIVLGARMGLLRSKSMEETSEGTSLDFELLGAPLFGTLAYEHVLGDATVYIGLGGGVVYSRTKLSSMSSGERTLINLTLAGTGFVGTRVPLGLGHLVGRFSYARSPIESEGISGDLLGLALEAGYGFDL